MAEITSLKLSKEQARYYFYFEMVKCSFKDTINVARDYNLTRMLPVLHIDVKLS